jgi:uncharacterized SAM-binding protein YcdF (DUF218 family)
MNKRIAFTVLIVITSLFICIMILFSSLFLNTYASKQFARAEKKKPYDVIIVPGFPFDPLLGEWDTLMRNRVLWSYYLYKNGLSRNVIYSGGAVYSPYIESKIMAMYGEKIGIDEQHIFTEERAEHSTENIYYSYLLAQKLGFNKIAIATDPSQSFLLYSFCIKENLKIDFIPIINDSLVNLNVSDISIDAESAKIKNFVSILDRETRLKRFKGTLGLNINKK